MAPEGMPILKNRDAFAIDSHRQRLDRVVTECFSPQYHSMLKQQELSVAMMVTSREVFSALTQLVPCVGCRRSVERLFSQLVESGNPALEPLTVKPTGVLSATKGCVSDARKLFTLFYVHG